MPLNITTPYEDLESKLKKFQAQGLYFLGQYVFAGSQTEPFLADAFRLWHLPYVQQIQRIVMLFGDARGMRAAMLELKGRCVSSTESENADFLFSAFLALTNPVPSQHVELTEEGSISSPVRLIYPQPVFLPLLQKYGLISAGCDLATVVYAGWEERYANTKREIKETGSFANRIREYFELDSPEDWAVFMDPTYEGKGTGLRDLAKYLEGLMLIRQDMEELEAEGLRNADSLRTCREQAEGLIAKLKERMRLLAGEIRLETPYAQPETRLAMWHLDRAFPEDLSYGELEGIYAALGQEMSRYRKRKPEDENLDVFRLWQCHWSIRLLDAVLEQPDAERPADQQLVLRPLSYRPVAAQQIPGPVLRHYPDRVRRDQMNYYIADLHLGHGNAISFDRRPFGDAEEMDRGILQNWNARVKPEDTVYLLGDVFFKNNERNRGTVKRLHGHKHLVRGNHDHVGAELLGCFESVQPYLELSDDGTRLILCHYPMPFYNRARRGAVMLYGHVHNSPEWALLEKWKRECRALGIPCNMINVGCMMPYMSYTPRTLKEILTANPLYPGEKEE